MMSTDTPPTDTPPTDVPLSDVPVTAADTAGVVGGPEGDASWPQAWARLTEPGADDEDLWSVTVTAVITDELTEEQVDALLSALAPRGHLGGGSREGDGVVRVEVTVSVADSTGEGDEVAVAAGERQARRLLGGVGVAGVQVVAVEAVTAVEQRRRLAVLVPFGLVGAAEVQQMLGVSRSRFAALRAAGKLPERAGEVAATPLWTRASIEAFLASWPRRTGRPPKTVLEVKETTQVVVAALQTPAALTAAVRSSTRTRP